MTRAEMIETAIEWQDYAEKHAAAARLFIFGGDRYVPRIVDYQREAARGYAWARHFIDKLSTIE